MRLISRTRCFLNTHRRQRLVAKLLGLFKEKHNCQASVPIAGFPGSWMAYSEQVSVFGWSAGFSGTDLPADANAGEAVFKALAKATKVLNPIRALHSCREQLETLCCAQSQKFILPRGYGQSGPLKKTTPQSAKSKRFARSLLFCLRR